jgi:hypothetical protein
MAIRTLRRKVIIREYDYKKVAHDALLNRQAIALYDRASFSPIKLTDLEKHQMIEILKGKEQPTWRDLQSPAIALYNVKASLYDPRYYDWQVTFDEEGYLCVQSRKNTPLSRIGWGIFEKDLTARI